MTPATLHPPQLIVDARMLYLVWLPEDAAAASALVPGELEVADGAPVFLNQYAVDDGGQTSGAGSPDGFGAYSLTYLGVELAGLDLEDGTPGRWWTHYLDSSENMIRYAAEHGVPADVGRDDARARGWNARGHDLRRRARRFSGRPRASGSAPRPAAPVNSGT